MLIKRSQIRFFCRIFQVELGPIFSAQMSSVSERRKKKFINDRLTEYYILITFVYQFFVDKELCLLSKKSRIMH